VFCEKCSPQPREKRSTGKVSCACETERSSFEWVLILIIEVGRLNIGTISSAFLIYGASFAFSTGSAGYHAFTVISRLSVGSEVKISGRFWP